MKAFELAAEILKIVAAEAGCSVAWNQNADPLSLQQVTTIDQKIREVITRAAKEGQA